VIWHDISRVLAPGGTYLSQQVGPGSSRELTDFMTGAQPVADTRFPERAVTMARAVGLAVSDLREATLEVGFHDVGAVVYFLRKVLWTVPGFTVGTYRPRLEAMHKHIQRNGVFLSRATRFLIEARKS
jgi:hypothetical protein